MLNTIDAFMFRPMVHVQPFDVPHQRYEGHIPYENPNSDYSLKNQANRIGGQFALGKSDIK